MLFGYVAIGSPPTCSNSTREPVAFPYPSPSTITGPRPFYSIISDVTAEYAFERSVGAGVAYRPSDNLLFAVDAVLEDGFAAGIGAEYCIRQFALRAGGVLAGGEHQSRRAQAIMSVSYSHPSTGIRS
ncbi:MAG: hypothetical protein PHP20_07340 [Firmicutes bacterium]|nr:hypothetical protein [Bacillota bacterium]MDD4792865.1 hypothetical protein [Bacillota bacterium]